MNTSHKPNCLIVVNHTTRFVMCTQQSKGKKVAISTEQIKWRFVGNWSLNASSHSDSFDIDIQLGKRDYTSISGPIFNFESFPETAALLVLSGKLRAISSYWMRLGRALLGLPFNWALCLFQKPIAVRRSYFPSPCKSPMGGWTQDICGFRNLPESVWLFVKEDILCPACEWCAAPIRQIVINERPLEKGVFSWVRVVLLSFDGNILLSLRRDRLNSADWWNSDCILPKRLLFKANSRTRFEMSGCHICPRMM